MKLTSPIRMAFREVLIPSTLLATLCCGISVSHAQSKPSAAVAVSAPSVVANSPKPQMTVDYAAGKLTVTATNASLNRILREVSRSIGMKITGGVADERVFGQYGPSTPSVVLADLLDGTGSNMLLVDGAKGPTELILTPARAVQRLPARVPLNPSPRRNRRQNRPARPFLPMSIPFRLVAGSDIRPPREHRPTRTPTRPTRMASHCHPNPQMGPRPRNRSTTNFARCSSNRRPRHRSKAESAFGDGCRRGRAAPRSLRNLARMAVKQRKHQMA